MRRSASTWLSLALTLGFVSAGLAALDDEITGDLKKMQGNWSFSLPDGANGTFSFEGKSVRTEVAGQLYVSTAKLDEKAEPHRTIDFEIAEGPAEAVGKSVYGIYRLDDAGFVICVGAPGQSRPTEFKAVEGETFLFELKK
jgi:uncharacterized protein (TIGR03067 family)